MYLTTKASSSEITRQKNMSQKDQYEERYDHLKVSHLDRNDRHM